MNMLDVGGDQVVRKLAVDASDWWVETQRLVDNVTDCCEG